MNLSRRLQRSSVHFVNEFGIASLRGNEQAQMKLTAKIRFNQMNIFSEQVSTSRRNCFQLQLCRTTHSYNKTSLLMMQNRKITLLDDNAGMMNPKTLNLVAQRFVSGGSKENDSGRDNIVEFKEKSSGKELTVGHKVAQAGKDASYMVILLIGFGITGCLVWYVASELLFSFSANSVYSKAVKLIDQNKMVEDFCGSPLKYYGEETSRGRRRHVSYQEYIVDGENYMRVKFYVAGSNRKGVVHADAKETSRGRFQFRFLFVEMQDFPHETVVIEDNRRDMEHSY